jgi:hypothetical protein
LSALKKAHLVPVRTMVKTCAIIIAKPPGFIRELGEEKYFGGGGEGHKAKPQACRSHKEGGSTGVPLVVSLLALGKQSFYSSF